MDTSKNLDETLKNMNFEYSKDELMAELLKANINVYRGKINVLEDTIKELDINKIYNKKIKIDDNINYKLLLESDFFTKEDLINEIYKKFSKGKIESDLNSYINLYKNNVNILKNRLHDVEENIKFEKSYVVTMKLNSIITGGFFKKDDLLNVINKDYSKDNLNQDLRYYLNTYTNNIVVLKDTLSNIPNININPNILESIDDTRYKLFTLITCDYFTTEDILYEINKGMSKDQMIVEITSYLEDFTKKVNIIKDALISIL